MNGTETKRQALLSANVPLKFDAAYALVILLLVWIPLENTPLGRAYNYVVGLNSGSLAVDMSTVYFQWMLLFTISVPFLISIVSTAVPFIPGPMRLVRVGLFLWVSGSIVSTVSQISDPAVVLDSAAGIISAGAVFFAVRRVRLPTEQHYELACGTVALTGLITSGVDLVRYHAAWGFPSLQKIILIKYMPEFWSDHCFFGNPDNASCAYGIFAMLSIGVLFGGVFSRRVRMLMIITLLSCSVEIVLTMARTGIVFLGVAVIASAVVTRRRRLVLTSVLLSALVIFGTSGFAESAIVSYFMPAISYDVGDSNTQSRIQSMQEGWKAFQDNFLTGVGTGRSAGVVEEDVPHELAIWQATEYGILGLSGVLLVMVGCFSQLASFLWYGTASYASRLTFALSLAPTMYFLRGLVSNAAVSNSVFNTWICLIFSLLAMTDRSMLQDPN